MSGVAVSDVPRRQFILSLGGGLIFLAIVALGFTIWRYHLDQQHDLRARRVTACSAITEPANRTLCIVESK